MGAGAVVVPANLQGCISAVGNLPGACTSDAITCVQTVGSALFECPGVITEGIGDFIEGVGSWIASWF
jgi:hypothetical protein